MPYAVKVLIKLAALFALVATVSACQSDGGSPTTSILTGNVFGDLGARSPSAVGDGTVVGYQTGPQVQTFGSGSPGIVRIAGQSAPSEGGSGGGSYTLNFDNTDIKDVVRAILRDALGVNYTVTGDVAGPVTISSARPVTRDELLSTLETILASFGYTLSQRNGAYQISATASGGALDNAGSTSPGYGVSLVPLRYLNANEMMEILSGFIAQGENLRVVPSRNMLIVQGNGTQRAETVRTILSFDADFMENQTVSIFRLREARPDAVISELERIFRSEGANGAIVFKPIERLRGILAISQNPKLIRRAASWVTRLDDDSPAAGQNVTVYKVRYRKAEELAKVMTNLFGGGSSSVNRQGSAASSFPALEPEDATGAPNGTAAGFNNAAFLDSGSPDNRGESRIAAAFGEQSEDQNGGAYGGVPNVLDLTQQGGGGGRNGVNISADPSNNSVVVYADSDITRKIVASLRQLDSTPVQVAIQVTIAEVRLTDRLKYGVQYFLKSNSLGLGRDNGSASLVNTVSDMILNQVPGFNFVLGSGANPDVIISALDSISDVQVLSSPSLVVLENQTASLQVGDQVPVTTRSAQSLDDSLAPIVNQIEFKDTGILLNVTPRIARDDTVTMTIQQQISSVSSGSNTLTPTISTRRVSSEISVNNGQTVLLGGLISAGSTTGRDGIPGVARIPIIGNLFSTTDDSKTRNELVVLIRPVVIRDGQDAASVAQELRSQMWAIGSTQQPLK